LFPYISVLLAFSYKCLVGIASGFKRFLILVLLKSSDVKCISQMALYSFGIQLVLPVAAIHFSITDAICGNLKNNIFIICYVSAGKIFKIQ